MMRPRGTGRLSRIAGWVALSYTLTIAGFQFWDAVRESDGVVFLLSLMRRKVFGDAAR